MNADGSRGSARAPDRRRAGLADPDLCRLPTRRGALRTRCGRPDLRRSSHEGEPESKLVGDSGSRAPSDSWPERRELEGNERPQPWAATRYERDLHQHQHAARQSHVRRGMGAGQGADAWTRRPRSPSPPSSELTGSVVGMRQEASSDRRRSAPCGGRVRGNGRCRRVPSSLPHRACGRLRMGC